ncbi:phage tail assembly chaperone G [Salinicoccus roseus]|uniref:Tail assembly chaperone n=1 Tax=Salinicoccus roseus TaxID=45670 RepID=A0A265E6G8_9STAP|nr:hypothetical protein [Salinicoccus roseus]OZT77110.1 hypothetical protein CFN03_08520 [Salinicoccus roseus]
MTIKLKLRQEDGSVKTYERPDTTVLEEEKFFELQDKARKAAIDEKKSRIEIQNMQLQFIVDLFKGYGDFTLEDMKLGILSKEKSKTIRGIFAQITPEDFEDDSKPKKK